MEKCTSVLSVLWQFYPNTQCADGESNKIVWDKKETATA